MPKVALPAFIAGSPFGSFIASLARGITISQKNLKLNVCQTVDMLFY